MSARRHERIPWWRRTRWHWTLLVWRWELIAYPQIRSTYFLVGVSRYHDYEDGETTLTLGLGWFTVPIVAVTWFDRDRAKARIARKRALRRQLRQERRR